MYYIILNKTEVQVTANAGGLRQAFGPRRPGGGFKGGVGERGGVVFHRESAQRSGVHPPSFAGWEPAPGTGAFSSCIGAH